MQRQWVHRMRHRRRPLTSRRSASPRRSAWTTPSRLRRWAARRSRAPCQRALRETSGGSGRRAAQPCRFVQPRTTSERGGSTDVGGRGCAVGHAPGQAWSRGGLRGRSWWGKRACTARRNRRCAHTVDPTRTDRASAQTAAHRPGAVRGARWGRRHFRRLGRQDRAVSYTSRTRRRVPATYVIQAYLQSIGANTGRLALHPGMPATGGE